MKKKPMRIISLVLALVMVVSLLPLSALAGETYKTQKVAVVVYSAEFTKTLKTVFETAAKNGVTASLEDLNEIVQDAVAEGLNVPDVELSMTAVDDDSISPVTLTEYENFNLFKSLQPDIPAVQRTKEFVNTYTFGSLSFLDDLKKGLVNKTNEYVDSVMETLLGSLNVYGSIYRVYVGEVPVKDEVNGTEYTLKVESFNKSNDPDMVQAGYILCDDKNSDFYSAREYTEVVKLRDDDEYQFLGNKNVGLKGDINPFTYVAKWIEDKKEESTIWSAASLILTPILNAFNDFLGDTSFKFIFPGLWCAESNAGFTFQNTDIVSNPLMSSTFLMVDREELVNVLEFIVDLGKDTVKELMKAAFSEEYEGYDNLVSLHMQLINTDEEQMSIDKDKLFEIVKVYLAVISNVDLMDRLVDTDTGSILTPFKLKVQLPAILEASADENGLVTFNRQSNITLVWMLKLIPEMKNLAVKALEGTGVLENVPDVLLKLLDYADEAATKAEDEIADFANGLPYALAQRFGLVGPKMQDDHYIMFQIKSPTDADNEAYWLNPMAYTMNVKWINADWVYVTLAELGIIGPYFAEGLYEFVANTTYASVIDNILGKVFQKDDFNWVTKILSGKDNYDVTEAALGALTAYAATIGFGSLGGDKIFANTEALAADLNQYLLDHGRTAQNLMVYLNNLALKAKDIYAGNLNKDDGTYWQFYNLNKSNTATITKLIQKSTDSIAACFENEKEAQVITTVGGVVNKVATNISTSVEKVATQVKAQVKSTATTVAKKVASTAVSTAKKAASNLLSNLGSLFKKSSSAVITFNA